MWESAPTRSTLLLASIAWVVGVSSSPALAARPTLDYETIKKTDAPIILAEVVEAKEVSRRRPADPSKTDDGYAITLKVIEVLRGELTAKTIQIPFSSKGYACVWEFGAHPEKGAKLLVFLAGGKDDTWSDHGMPYTIRPVEAFDAAPVKTVRKILEFWTISPQKKQEEALREGCLGEDLGFRLYCVRVLGDRALNQGTDAPEAFSFLWEVYTSDRADVDTWLACENTFQNTFRSFGWSTYEPRYAILRAMVERTWKDKSQSPHQSLNCALINLAAYPDHRAQTLELFSTLTSGPREDVAASTAFYMSRLYEFFPGAEDEKALNAKLLAKLVALMTKDKSSSGMAAAGVADLVRNMLKMGITRDDLVQLVAESAAKDYPKEAQGRLATARRDLADKSLKMKPLAVDEARPVVQQDLAGHIGKAVRVVGKASWERTPEYGTAMEVDGRLIWLPDLKKWPWDFPRDNYMVASGELGQKEDIPVFRYEKGKPFGQGLPVPQPYDLKGMSRRFVLQNAKWELIEKP